MKLLGQSVSFIVSLPYSSNVSDNNPGDTIITAVICYKPCAFMEINVQNKDSQQNNAI